MKKLILNKLSGHAQKAIIGKLNIKNGTTFSKGQELAALEAGKGNYMYKAEYSGTITKLLVKEGDEIAIGQCIAETDVVEEETNEVTATKKSSYSFGIACPKHEEVKCDLLVVGGGPGGYVAAIKGAQSGLRTLLVEKDRLGGTCLNHGCIPTKSLIEGIKVFESVNKAEDFGINVVSSSISLEKLGARKDNVVDTLVSGIDHLMDSNNVRVIKGEAVVDNKGSISIKNSKVDVNIVFDKLILALGSKPSLLPIKGIESDRVISSKELLANKEIPTKLTIVGGGVIGMEFAFIYNSLGSKVTVVEYADSILPNMDNDVVEVISTSAKKRGINIITSAMVEEIIETVDDNVITRYTKDDKVNHIASDIILMSVGRKANMDSVDIQRLDVNTIDDKRGIAVNEYMQTSNPDVYAIGDVTNIMQLAHVASHQGIVAVEHICGGQRKMNYDNVPSAVFTQPEIGVVGVTEKEAMSKGLSIKTARFPMTASGKALAMSKTEGFIKLIAQEDLVIGGSIVGPCATDMLSIITNLIESKTNIEDAINVIYPHPTLSEGIGEALLMLKGRGLHFE